MAKQALPQAFRVEVDPIDERERLQQVAQPPQRLARVIHILHLGGQDFASFVWYFPLVPNVLYTTGRERMQRRCAASGARPPRRGGCAPKPAAAD